MPEEDILDSYKELLNYDDAARLLSMMYPESLKNSAENDLASPESFACLLYRYPALFDITKRALVLRSFDSVWSACKSYTAPPLRNYVGIKDIPKIFTGISSNLRNLVEGKINTPFWRLSSAMGGTIEGTKEDPLAIVKEINLHQLMQQTNIPPMLFYGLGSFKEHPAQHARLQRLFCKGQNTFFVNSSATGKTRLLYEGLFQHWGLYVTAHVDDLEAKALSEAMDSSYTGEEDMVSILPNESALGFQQLLDGNLRALDRRFSKVLLVHLLVFREFLKMAHAERVINDEDLRHRWLIAQLSFDLLDHIQDIHMQLLEALYYEPWGDVEKELFKVMEDIKPLLPTSVITDGLFVAIDEANYAHEQLWYSPYDVTERHPLIRSIIRTWRDRLASLGIPITFIVAGTEIPSEYFPSTSPEWSSWRWTSDTGSFDDEESQKRFILPFIPPSYAATPSGEALLQRIWKWCRPRHRLTASLVPMLLQDKMTHPHGVLNNYIKRLMSYSACDGAEFVTEEGPCSIRPDFYDIGQIARHLYPRSATHEVIFHYIVTGNHPPYFGINRIDVVTYGVGQFKDQDMQIIAMDQPGPLIAAAMYLNSGRSDKQKSLYSFTAFSSFYNTPWSGGDTYPAAAYISWYIALAFLDGRPMSHVFSFPLLGWLKNSSSHAQLVILRKDDHGVVEEMIVGTSALQPTSPPLGYVASIPEDVIAWLSQERTGAFCICPSDCGAELIFVLKIREKFVWVMLRTVGRSMQPEDIDMQTEFETFTEHNLFSRASHDTIERENRLKETLESLPNPLAPQGTFPVLRVLASFPTQPPLSRSVAKKAKAGPVAVLKNYNFQTITEYAPLENLIEALISSMHDHRLPYVNDAFSPIEIRPAPKLRKGKRKDSAEEPQEAPSEDDSSKASTSTDRLIRSIPRHLSPPSSPTLEAKPGPSSNVAVDAVEEASSPTPPPIPKRLKKERNVSSEGSNIAKPSASSADVSRRQSPRNAKQEIDSSKELSLMPPDAIPLRRSPREHKPKKSGGN